MKKAITFGKLPNSLPKSPLNWYASSPTEIDCSNHFLLRTTRCVITYHFCLDISFSWFYPLVNLHLTQNTQCVTALKCLPHWPTTDLWLRQMDVDTFPILENEQSSPIIVSLQKKLCDGFKFMHRSLSRSKIYCQAGWTLHSESKFCQRMFIRNKILI